MINIQGGYTYRTGLVLDQTYTYNMHVLEFRIPTVGIWIVLSSFQYIKLLKDTVLLPFSAPCCLWNSKYWKNYNNVDILPVLFMLIH